MRNHKKYLLLIIILSLLLMGGKLKKKELKITNIKTYDNNKKIINVKLSEKKTLLRNGKLGLKYFPDEAVLLIRRKPTYRILVTSAISTYLLEGDDLENIKSAKKVIKPGGKGSFDNGYVGASGLYRNKDGKIFTFYHGEDQEGMGTLEVGSGIPGFYCSIGTAVSSDDGVTWKKIGQVITSSKPKEWYLYEGQHDRGAGEPGAVLSKDGKYLYIYYTEHSRQDNRGVQACMARISTNNFSIKNCKKYYKGEFSEPGIGGMDTPVFSAKYLDDAEVLFPHVHYSKTLNKYIMICNINFWKEYIYNTGLKKSGIYIVYSDDGINWKNPTSLITDNSVPLVGKSLSWQANIIWDEGFDTKGWLVYGYTPRWGHTHDNSGTPHYMVGRRISFD